MPAIFPVIVPAFEESNGSGGRFALWTHFEFLNGHFWQSFFSHLKKYDVEGSKAKLYCISDH